MTNVEFFFAALGATAVWIAMFVGLGRWLAATLIGKFKMEITAELTAGLKTVVNGKIDRVQASIDADREAFALHRAEVEQRLATGSTAMAVHSQRLDDHSETLSSTTSQVSEVIGEIRGLRTAMETR